MTYHEPQSYPKSAQSAKETLEAFKVLCLIEQPDNSHSEAFNEERTNMKNLLTSLEALQVEFSRYT